MATSGQALRHILPERLHGEIDRVTREEVNYQRDIVPLLRLQPGFLEFANDLHAGGVRMAIATNRISRGIQTVLDFFALPSYFDPVVTASNAAPSRRPRARGASAPPGASHPRTCFLWATASMTEMRRKEPGTVFAAFNGGELRGRITAADFSQLRRALGNALPPLPASRPGRI